MQTEDVSRINLEFGVVMLLYSKSELHRSWRVDMASKYILPALLTKQYLIMKDSKGVPLGYASWAYFDLQREAQYIKDPHSITIADWGCGDRLWFIDWVSPIDARITDEMYLHLKHQLFPNGVARSLRIKPGANGAKIKSYGGARVSIESRRVILSRYYAELKEFVGDDDSKLFF